MKQLAVEWLINQFELYYNGESEFVYCEIIEQAKEIEKQQIKDAYISGMYDAHSKISIDYYKENYETTV
jgi:hypothetical protein